MIIQPGHACLLCNGHKVLHLDIIELQDSFQNLFNFLSGKIRCLQLFVRHLAQFIIKPQRQFQLAGRRVFLYPFVQRYFVKGLTIGAVKG